MRLFATKKMQLGPKMGDGGDFNIRDHEEKKGGKRRQG